MNIQLWIFWWHLRLNEDFEMPWRHIQDQKLIICTGNLNLFNKKVKFFDSSKKYCFLKYFTIFVNSVKMKPKLVGNMSYNFPKYSSGAAGQPSWWWFLSLGYFLRQQLWYIQDPPDCVFIRPVVSCVLTNNIPDLCQNFTLYSMLLQS